MKEQPFVEEEIKLLIKDRRKFEEIRTEISAASKIMGYDKAPIFSKERAYRYFDTPSLDLQEQEAYLRIGLLESHGATCSLRYRGKDMILTAKILASEGDITKRIEHPHSLSASGIDEFYRIDFDTLIRNAPETQAKAIYAIVGKKSLQEMVRFKVQTHRTELSLYGKRLEIALDEVIATSMLNLENPLEVDFFELEVENRSGSTREDLDEMVDFLSRGYNLDKVSLSKYQRAMELIRTGKK